MGMTLWISTLNDRNIIKNTNDHSAMYRHADALDSLCGRLEIEKLSSFFDFTDIQYDFREDFDDDEEQNSETGDEYGIDDMVWFDSASGLTTLNALYENIGEAEELRALQAPQRQQLLEEFDDCLLMLRESAARNGKFHLAVIM